MFVQKGSIKISVLSRTGKEAVVAMLGPGDFFGEGALTGQPIRIATATATIPTTVLVIEKGAMRQLLRDEPTFSERFISYMLERNLRVEADLVELELAERGARRQEIDGQRGAGGQEKPAGDGDQPGETATSRAA